jgi:hypothetical protein
VPAQQERQPNPALPAIAAAAAAAVAAAMAPQKPKAVLFDVNQTLFSLEPVRNLHLRSLKLPAKPVKT